MRKRVSTREWATAVYHEGQSVSRDTVLMISDTNTAVVDTDSCFCRVLLTEQLSSKMLITH